MLVNDRSDLFRHLFWGCLVWTMVVGGSLYWSYLHEHESTLALARSEAFANINKDLTFRRWATSHGGVFVPLVADTPANPYLVAPDREVETTSGRKLVLMNPAYMVRQMQQFYGVAFGIKGHITSLKPLNPNNGPDPWETEALDAFARGGLREISTETRIDGQPHMRAMLPMMTESGCLKCHDHQGYKVGEVRGGISATVPLAPYIAREHDMVKAMAVSHAAIWLLGLAVFSTMYRRAQQRRAEREATETEIRELNESLDRRVRERTKELERANRELESFSYSVSHDLRAPLRAMDGYARLLSEEELDRLSPEGRRMLERIWVNAGKMGMLIDDILQFSRISRSEFQHEAVDMTALVRGVVDELGGEYPAASLRVMEMPSAQGDSTMLRRVWTNLIGNALKFSARCEQPEIEIGAESKDGSPVYYIRDNGAGFDMAHADKLFGVFQRMHSEKDFPGTGAGLAIAKRIVERHGGKIWAEAEVGQGATFRFTLAFGD